MMFNTTFNITNATGLADDTGEPILNIATFKLPPEMEIEETGLGKVKGWTSLMHIKLILNIEKAFAIKIPSNKIQETQTFRSLLNLLSTLRA